jgi:hypothetical protein
VSRRATSTRPPPDYNWIKYAIFPADDRTFSITFAVPLVFSRLKVLSRPAAFDEMTRALPALAVWVAPEIAEPIGDPDHPVQAMGGLINRCAASPSMGNPSRSGSSRSAMRRSAPTRSTAAAAPRPSCMLICSAPPSMRTRAISAPRRSSSHDARKPRSSRSIAPP